MTRFLVVSLAALVMAAPARAADPAAAAIPAEYAALMAKAKQFTEPGPNHAALERFVGKWKTETRFFMGDKASPAEAGTSECSWLMAGRWLKCEGSGTMMGAPIRTFLTLGYDNFKMSYVSTMVTSMDTAMNRAEGDMDPSGAALLMYGTLDEYLTGEHDKMVKYAWRFVSADRIVLEVHDLPIGEKGTKVVETAFIRATE